MANPFDDPDVQAAASGGDAQQNSNVYGGGAYDNNTSSQAPPQMSKAQQDMAVTVGGAVAKKVATDAKNDIQNDYNENQKQQGDAYSAPETPNWCNKMFYWLPIRYFAWIAGICLIIVPIIDWILFAARISFVYGVIGAYLIFFGFLVTIVESPVFKLTRKPQLGIFYWFRLLSRMWGRATFYLFISILCFVEISGDGQFTISFLVGIYLFITAILMLVISRKAGTKYRRLFEFIASGTDVLAEDELAGKLTRKFDELDADQDGKIGSLEVVKIAEQSGRTLSNAERHAIQTFLDEHCNGAIARDDFVNQFMNHNLSTKWL